MFKPINMKVIFQDIIENEDIKLDWMFKVSLINDLTNVCIRKYVTFCKFLCHCTDLVTIGDILCKLSRLLCKITGSSPGCAHLSHPVIVDAGPRLNIYFEITTSLSLFCVPGNSWGSLSRN